ncbi:hypothetical protein [Sphingomonas morindae]|uniref:Uncharacterized protein n=1 Tax=Sphingomonas morindae TaxID=1541170 RepID=A0ABY4XE93_9SPHN|nr:hypothetical protein [Sphingomonas morindae]USI75168.1 hypothetical protein LHA26_19210 [Sphingomonas morindae]
MTIRLYIVRSAALAATALLLAPGTASAQAEVDIFGAALCEPPYSSDIATRVSDAVEKFTKPDMSMMGAAVYHLPKPIERDGFVTQAVVFSGASIGVLVEGHAAAQLAAKYNLQRETSDLLGASTLGFSRRLPDKLQIRKELGLISLIAREGPALGGKTLLACELDSYEDLERLEALKRYLSSRKAAPDNSENGPNQ